MPAEKTADARRRKDKSPEVIDVFRQVLKDHTAGDPMREEIKWTNLSRRQIAKRMTELGTPVSKNIVSRLLLNEGYRRRKLKKRTMGQHADRNAQFENIAKLKKHYIDAGHPVISIDKKRWVDLYGHPSKVNSGSQENVMNAEKQRPVLQTLPNESWEIAVESRKPSKGSGFHSDQGC